MKEKVIVGYDLGNQYSQISYCTYEDSVPETLSVVAGAQVYNIPTALCKRQGISQWFYGKDACKHAQLGEGVLVENLVEAARKGEPVLLEDEEYDPVALLTLFVKRSLTLLSMVSAPDKIAALMITCEQLDAEMVGILDTVVAGLDLKTKLISYQSHLESFFHYTIKQPAELWQHQVLVCDYAGERMRFFRMECNRHTTPVVAFMEREEYPFLTGAAGIEEEALRESLFKQLDERFLGLAGKVCEGRMITSVYLIGEDFSEEWLKESLRFLCRGRRVFQGNNLYSKGACYGMAERLFPGEIGKNHVFLGEDKLKANIGMKLKRRGEDSYYALLDAGTGWYEAQSSVDFLLEEGNSFSLLITPLNGREIKCAEVTLEGLPVRNGAFSRLHMELKMTTESCVRLSVEDMGFGELFPASHQVWTESFEVV
ncbi:MAG: hypothetical protein J1E83_00095 [Lachnospiraceae bacterium]|nr:hypothetical protein [Lachnospiraceae bacterium]